MPSIPIADGFLTGSLLSLLLPICLLIAIVIWFVFVVRRMPGGAASSATSGSATAGSATAGSATANSQAAQTRVDGGSVPAEPPRREP
jgi:hypothetical protein